MDGMANGVERQQPRHAGVLRSDGQVVYRKGSELYRINIEELFANIALKLLASQSRQYATVYLLDFRDEVDKKYSSICRILFF